MSALLAFPGARAPAGQRADERLPARHHMVEAPAVEAQHLDGDMRPFPDGGGDRVVALVGDGVEVALAAAHGPLFAETAEEGLAFGHWSADSTRPMESIPDGSTPRNIAAALEVCAFVPPVQQLITAEKGPSGWAGRSPFRSKNVFRVCSRWRNRPVRSR